MENIQEDYVSFETAKLIEKEDIKSRYDNNPTFYVRNDCGEYTWQKEGSFIFENKHLDETCCPNHGVKEENLIVAPTQALVLKWLRVKHDIHIFLIGSMIERNTGKFCAEIQTIKKQTYLWTNKAHTALPYEECMEVAIQYCLEHLIK